MAAAPDPDEVLRPTREKGHFQRLARLLISGGTTLLKEVFDQICPPGNLPTILNNPTTKKQLKAAKLTKPQWDCLYPSPGVYVKSENFDVTLLFRLLTTICNLTSPSTGWDALPAGTDHSLAAELARIKYYRNSVYGHAKQEMEITDDEFPQLWREMREALVAVAGQINPPKKQQWQEAIDRFLNDPLTVEDERNTQELLRWYENDIEVKQSIEELKTSTQEGVERLEEGLKDVQEGLKEAAHVLEETVEGEAKGIKDHIKEELKTATQIIERVVQEEAQNTRNKVDDVCQAVAAATAGGSQAAGVQIRLQMDCEAISGAGARGGASEIVTTSREPQQIVQGATVMPVTSNQQQEAPVAAFSEENVPHAGLPPTQGVLNFIAYKCFQGVDTSKPKELNGFVTVSEGCAQCACARHQDRELNNHTGMSLF
ncbi:hypothetical protein ACROYT_G036160 [Oculina patagonica]